jgi:hypothetical protein
LEPLDGEPIGYQGCLGAGVEHGKEVADVIVVVMGEEDPPDICGVDDRERRVEPLSPAELVARVDDHRLRSGDDHRVDGHDGSRSGRNILGDVPGLWGDSIRVVELGRRKCHAPIIGIPGNGRSGRTT